MNTQQIEQIELNIQEAREIIAVSDALERLGKNPDFIRVIDEGYFKAEAVRLVHLKAAPNMRSPENQAAIIKEIDAIGALAGYFHVISHKAMLAEAGIAADQETITELLNELESE